MRSTFERNIQLVNMSQVEIVNCQCFVVWLFADLKEMCELLGIEQSVLERAFSYRTVEARLEKVSTTLNVSQVRGKIYSYNKAFLFMLMLTLVHTHTHIHIHIHAVHRRGIFFPLTSLTGYRLSSMSRLQKRLHYRWAVFLLEIQM